MPRIPFPQAGLALVLLALPGAGCGPRQYPVEGSVTFPDGQPLRGGTVVFEKAEGTPIASQGIIQPDGTYRAGTHGRDDGMPEGTYRVLVSPPLPTIEEERRRTPSPIHPRFRRFETSQLELTVKPERNTFDIVVERP
jgi:hypothetical protein